MPKNSGSFAVMTEAKSAVIAVDPPTRTWRLVPLSAAGITSVRRREMRSLVRASCGEVVGTTTTMAIPAPDPAG